MVRYDKTAEHQGIATVAVQEAGGAVIDLGTGPVETLPYRQTCMAWTSDATRGRLSLATMLGHSRSRVSLSGWNLRSATTRADLMKAAEVEFENQIIDQ